MTTKTIQWEYANLYMRYLGVLKLLETCSPHVEEIDREMIELAFNDACKHHPSLRVGRLLNRITIEVG